MGVYISGLKMPQDGRITLQIDSTGGVYVVNKFSITSEKYEKSMIAIGIQPHGRLIDADALINELASEHVGGLEAIKKYTNADTWTAGLHTAWRTIDDADTVIEAERSEE